MKTLEAFIQRLQDDPAFEQQAHAFDHGDDLIAFVQREGYDFTLEQLMSEFERAEKSPGETGDLAPPPADVSPSPAPLPDGAEFPKQPDTLSSDKRGTDLPKNRNTGLTPKPPVERVPQSMAVMPLPQGEEEPRPGLFKGSGGRHRGFSPRRLKSASEEET
jgi:predicted ribosomally synthesized peptide with nif11-like leader